MRLNSMLAAAGLALALGMSATEPAGAFGTDPTVAPEGYGLDRVIHHFVYKPRYHHVYHSATHGDPYAYRYVRRAWYPYHASHYWVDAEHMRYRYRYNYTGPKYRYQPSWGRPKDDDHGGHGGKPAK
jgi:hypothetical protein